MYLSGVAFEELDFDTTLQTKPILSNAQEFLTNVPMVLAIWPALFLGFHRLSTKNGDRGQTDHDDSNGEDQTR
jgi:hypothetical protein